MTTTSDRDDIQILREALIPAIERDLVERPGAARGRRRKRRHAGTALAVFGVLATSAGVAAATGVLFEDPKPDPAVPNVDPWTYYSSNPYGHGGGPVLLRYKPGVIERENAAMEKQLADAGVTARCGTDRGHPLACWLPSGDLVNIAGALGPTQVIDESADDFEIRPLTDDEAHDWLCTHPHQRPGADGGEKPAPTKGYEDC